MFFENLPEELMLKIVNKTSLNDQIKLGQVNKKINRIVTTDNSSKLFNYKFKNKKYQVGDVCLFVKECKSENAFQSYELFSTFTKNGDAIAETEMWLEQEEFSAVAEAMEHGTLSLIDLLNSKGKTASKNAKLLQKEAGITTNEKNISFASKPRRV